MGLVKQIKEDIIAKLEGLDVRAIGSLASAEELKDVLVHPAIYVVYQGIPRATSQGTVPLETTRGPVRFSIFFTERNLRSLGEAEDLLIDLMDAARERLLGKASPSGDVYLFESEGRVEADTEKGDVVYEAVYFTKATMREAV
jgi:hypothetical protein